MQSPPHITEEYVKQLIDDMGGESATVGDVLAVVWNVQKAAAPSQQDEWRARNKLMDEIYEHIGKTKF
jgi:hypothetical protein